MPQWHGHCRVGQQACWHRRAGHTPSRVCPVLAGCSPRHLRDGLGDLDVVHRASASSPTLPRLIGDLKVALESPARRRVPGSGFVRWGLVVAAAGCPGLGHRIDPPTGWKAGLGSVVSTPELTGMDAEFVSRATLLGHPREREPAPGLGCHHNRSTPANNSTKARPPQAARAETPGQRPRPLALRWHFASTACVAQKSRGIG